MKITELKQTTLESICRKAYELALGGDKDAVYWISDNLEGKSTPEKDMKFMSKVVTMFPKLITK